MAERVSTKSRSVKMAVVATVCVIAALWVLACVGLYGVMRQPPERFARVMRNALDARPRGHVAGGQSRTGFRADETRQDGTGTTVVSDYAESPGGAGVWKLYLTSLPAGGSCPQQALPAVRRPGHISGGLHHRSASQRRVADGEQRKRQSRIREPSQ